MPGNQKNVFATAIAVSESASEIPKSPSGPDHQAASGTRNAVNSVPTSIGQKV